MVGKPLSAVLRRTDGELVSFLKHSTAHYSTVTGGQSSLKIYLNRSIVTDSKNTHLKVGSNDKYFYLNKSKKVIAN